MCCRKYEGFCILPSGKNAIRIDKTTAAETIMVMAKSILFHSNVPHDDVAGTEGVGQIPYPPARRASMGGAARRREAASQPARLTRAAAPSMAAGKIQGKNW